MHWQVLVNPTPFRDTRIYVCRISLSSERQLLMQYKTSWASSDFLVDLSRYADTRVSEFSRHSTLPSALMEDEAAFRRSSRGAALRQQVSLRSSPVVLFFQTLLPWNELDLTGELISFCLLHSAFSCFSMQNKALGFLVNSEWYWHGNAPVPFSELTHMGNLCCGVAILNASGLHAEPVYIGNIVSAVWSFCAPALEAGIRAVRAKAASAADALRMAFCRATSS